MFCMPIAAIVVVVDFKLKRLDDNCLEMTKGKTSPNEKKLFETEVLVYV
jgi:hypothetical protein